MRIREKAQAAATTHDGIILAGDTVVACGRRILPKAEAADTAQSCLRLLSGRQHRVYGGIALITADRRLLVRVVCSQVKFRRLSGNDIADAMVAGDWQGKAGGAKFCEAPASSAAEVSFWSMIIVGQPTMFTSSQATPDAGKVQP